MRVRFSVSRSISCAFAVAALACAGTAFAQDAQAQVQAQPAQQQQPARFNMIQNGKKMTADDFDKWMAAQGYQSPNRPAAGPETAVAKAEPAAKKKAAANKVVAAATTRLSFADVTSRVVSPFADVSAKVTFAPRAM